MTSFLGQQLSIAAKPAAAKSVDTTVRAATKKAPAGKKAAPAGKKAPAKTAFKAKNLWTANEWTASDDGFEESKFYGPDRVLYLPPNDPRRRACWTATRCGARGYLVDGGSALTNRSEWKATP